MIASPHPVAAIATLRVAAGDEPGLASAEAEPARLDSLLRTARRVYTPLGVAVADSRSRRWARRSRSPYVAAVDRVGAMLGTPGAHLLNYSYEWGCTSAAGEDLAAGGPTLLRTLDWPFPGLGRAVVLVEHAGPAGAYASVTWPGLVGVLTGCAPGRFAAAINQPPLPLPSCGKAVGWLAARWLVNRSTALPPSHLLRLAFETCKSFAEAVAMLETTPLCMPAIFVVAGSEPGERIVIERTRGEAFRPELPAAANHWAAASAPPGRPRNASSRERRAAMAALIGEAPDWSLAWLGPPILVDETRLVVMANPRSGRLVVRGIEAGQPATATLDTRLQS